MIALDFDGTLAEYHGSDGGVAAAPGPPLPGMLDLVKALTGRHRATVVVFSARAGNAHGVKVIRDWLKTHGFPALEVTNIKRPEFRVILDDRAIRFVPRLVAEDPGWFAEALMRSEPHYRRTET